MADARIDPKFAASLLKTQQEISEVEKSADNPYFKSKYADLSAVIDHLKPILNRNGIVFLQFPSTPPFENYLALTTLLLHVETGQILQDTAIAPLAKADPQGFGSAVTYLRRYGLQSILGLKTVDDDGEAAADHGRELQKPKAPATFRGSFPKAAAPAKPKASIFPIGNREVAGA